jgi:uncharacterized membrane protein YdbT with pleckstrin-like domain
MRAKTRKKGKAVAEAPAEVVEAVKEKVAGKSAKKKRMTFGRLLFLAVAGGVAALVASEPLRSRVLDVLFGAEEEFQYTPPVSTAPSAPAAEPSVGAA